jgi:cytoskeletal protein CcmA (bactofilin family)
MWKKSEPEQSHPQPIPGPQVQSTPITQSPVARVAERSVIGPSISIKGNLAGEEDLLIEGRVEGKIELRNHSVAVGKNGHIKADIHGKVITVEGSVEGNLYGEEQLVVKQSATVVGNITCPRVALEDGSNFKGSIDMGRKGKEMSLVPPSAPDKSFIES